MRAGTALGKGKGKGRGNARGDAREKGKNQIHGQSKTHRTDYSQPKPPPRKQASQYDDCQSGSSTTVERLRLVPCCGAFSQF